MSFTHTMADIAPGQVVALAKAELMEELPQDRIDRVEREERARLAWLERIRAIPEKDRTDAQRRALKPEFFPISPLGRDHVERDDIGINRHHQFYYPTSARHEPFASLFAKNPEAALRTRAGPCQPSRPRVASGPRHQSEPDGHSDPGRDRVSLGDTDILGRLAHLQLVHRGARACSHSSPRLAVRLAAMEIRLKADGPPTSVFEPLVEGTECHACLGNALVPGSRDVPGAETPYRCHCVRALGHA